MTFTEQLEALLAKATLAPWSAFTEREQTGFRMVRTRIIADDPDIVLAEIKADAEGNEEANATLIALLRNNATAILARAREIETLRAAPRTIVDADPGPQILIWLGFYRDLLPPDAIKGLQDIALGDTRQALGEQP